MKLRPVFKVLLFLLTLWMPVYMIGSIVRVFHMAMNPPAIGNFQGGLEGWFVIHLATMVLGLLLLAFYVVHLFRTDRVDGGRRALWGVVLFMAGPVAMTVYWCKYVWPERNA